MALVLKDRVKETTTTSGTGTLTLAGAAFGFQAFSVVGNGNTTYYAIVDATTGDWEVGIGTYTASGTTLSRTTVLSSSNGGALVAFSANIKDVFCTYPASQSANINAALTSGRVTFATTDGLLTDSANLTFNGTTLSAAGLSDSGNLAFTGTGNRITGDFSNATIANRVAFQSSTTNGNTQVTVFPNGTATNAGLDLYSNSDPTNTSRGLIRIDTTGVDFKIDSNRTGTGTYLPMTFHTGGNERLRLDTDGNLGLGVTPAAFTTFTTSRAFQFGRSGSLFYSTDLAIAFFGNNYYQTAPFTTFYLSTGFALRYAQNDSDGSHAWLTAPTGTAGNAATFTQLMTLNSSGNLGIGTTSPTAKLHVTGTEVRLQGSSSFYSFYDTAGTTRAGYIQNNVGALNFVGELAQPMQFYTNNTERARIDSSGNVGIGTTSNTLNQKSVLYMAGAVAGYFQISNGALGLAATNGLRLGVTAAGLGELYAPTSLAYYINNTEGMRLNSTGLGIGTTSPLGNLQVSGTTKALTGGYGQLNVFSTDAIGADKGGKISFGGVSGAAGFDPYGFCSIAGYKDNATASNFSGYLQFSTATSGGTVTERLRITSAGNVGIGTTSPAAPLDVNGSIISRASGGEGGELVLRNPDNASNGMVMDVVSANAGRIFNTANNFSLSIGQLGGTGGTVVFYTEVAERMRITAAGNVGIGTSSPTSKLHVSGGRTDLTANSETFALGVRYNSSGGLYYIGATNSATPDMVFSQVGGTERMRIANTGIVTMGAYGAGTATFSAAGVISSVSDETWKTKDGAPVDTDAMLKKLEPGYWYYNDEKKESFGADRQLGFYAQNVNAAIGPEAAPEPEEGKPWGYYDRSVLAVVVMSLQKALATIESLEARIATLESKP